MQADTTNYFVVWWVLFEYSSFDHFPKNIKFPRGNYQTDSSEGKYASFKNIKFPRANYQTDSSET